MASSTTRKLLKDSESMSLVLIEVIFTTSVRHCTGKRQVSSSCTEKVDLQASTAVGSESIIPMTYKEAQEWTEEYLDGDDYISIFGEPDDSDGKKTVGFVLTDGAISKLKQEASKRGITQSALIEELISKI